MADLTLKKLAIASELKIIQYKIIDFQNFNLNVSVWSSRDMNEETYLGEVFVNLEEVINKAGEWAVNGKFKLSAEEYEKDVKGGIILQVRWTPDDDY